MEKYSVTPFKNVKKQILIGYMGIATKNCFVFLLITQAKTQAILISLRFLFF